MLVATLVVGMMVMLGACGDANGQKPEISQTAAPTQAVTPTEEPAPTATAEPTKVLPTITPTESPTVQRSELELLQEKMTDSGKICAAAYLGYLPEGGYAEFMAFVREMGLLAQFPFLADIPEENTVMASGGEWYVLVPPDDKVRFTVSECILDETSFMLAAGKELLSQEIGEPVLLRGNVSDIYPSFMVKVSGADGTVINYTPGLSLKDGSLLAEDGVYDFTVYE